MTTLTDLIDRLIRPARDRFLALPLPGFDEDPRLDLAKFLREEGWPSNAITAHATGLFAAAVRRRYERERGQLPPWKNGYVYEGYADWLIIRDTYEEEIGAIAEQLAFEGTQR